jgi:hypothetical protein
VYTLASKLLAPKKIKEATKATACTWGGKTTEIGIAVEPGWRATDVTAGFGAAQRRALSGDGNITARFLWHQHDPLLQGYHPRFLWYHQSASL